MPGRPPGSSVNDAGADRDLLQLATQKQANAIAGQVSESAGASRDQLQA